MITGILAGFGTPVALDGPLPLLMHFDGNLDDAYGNHQAISQGSHSYVGGVSGQGLRFPDDINSFVQVGEEGAFDFLGDFTLEFWVSSSSFGTDRVIGMYDAATGAGWRLEDSNGNLRWRFYTSGTLTSNMGRGSGLQHMAVVRSLDVLSIYYAGSRRWTGDALPLQADLTSGGFLFLGSDPTLAGDDRFTLDELRVTRGVALYNDETYTVPAAPFST